MERKTQHEMNITLLSFSDGSGESESDESILTTVTIDRRVIRGKSIAMERERATSFFRSIEFQVFE